MDPEALKQQTEIVAQITRHQTALRAYIAALMPGKTGVSDVLQETNIVLWEKRDKFKPGTNFRAWACAIARFEVKRHRRNLLKAGRILLDEDLAAQLAEQGAETPDEVDQRMRALDHCLGRLPENDRRLVEHRYFSKQTLEVFSNQCGRTVESLRVSLHRIRGALRKCINNELAES